MRLSNTKRIQAPLILLFMTLFPSSIVAQFKSDLRQQLYPPFLQDKYQREELIARRDALADKMKWQKNAFAQQDSNLTLIGLWPWGPCTTVAARDHYAFIGNGGLFQVFDISNPATPQILSEVFLGQSLAYDIKLKGDLAFVADGNLKVIDISDPTKPQRIAALYLPETFAVRILISGNYAYIGSLGSILSVVDISTPTAPFVNTTFRLSDDFVKNLAIYENHLFIKTEHPLAPIYIYEVSDLDNPRLAGFYAQRAYAFAASGNHLYLTADDSSFQVLDLTTPVTPRLISSIYIPFRGRVMSVKDSLAYVTTGNTLLAVVDISNPFSPSLRGSISGSPSTSVSIAVAHPLVLANTGIGFWTIDVRDPDHPLTLAHFATGDAASNIEILDDFLFLCSLKAGLFVVDISNSQNPQFISNLSLGGWVDDIAIIDSLAFLSGYPFGGNLPPQLSIVNLAQPIYPRTIAQVSVLSVLPPPLGGLHPTALAISENHAFVTHNWGVSIINISDKTNPQLVKLITTQRIPRDIAISDNFACLANGEAGLRIFDITDPENPQEKAIFPGVAVGVTMRDDTVLVALGGNLVILKILSSGSASKLGELATPGSRSTVDLALQGHFAYMAYGEDLFVIDISDLGQPYIVGHALTPAYARGVAINGNGSEVFVTGITWALQVYRNNLITRVNETRSTRVSLSPRLYPNHPNPFNSSSVIEYNIPNSGRVELKVFDSLGKEVAELVNGWQSVGTYSVTFDANNLRTGIYFCRLRFRNNWLFTQKMLILK